MIFSRKLKWKTTFSTFSQNSFDIPNFTHFRLWHTPPKMPILGKKLTLRNQFQTLKKSEKKNPNSRNSISRTTFEIPTRCRTLTYTFGTLPFFTYSVLMYITFITIGGISIQTTEWNSWTVLKTNYCESICQECFSLIKNEIRGSKASDTALVLTINDAS